MSCIATLKSKGLRLTQPRRVIADYIHDHGGHVSPEEIISYAHGKYPRINKSTVYRTLELLENNHCVFKSELGNQTIYHHAEEGHHHHLVCLDCGKTVDCEERIFAPVEAMLQDKYHFQAQFKHVIIGGLCEGCRNETR